MLILTCGMQQHIHYSFGLHYHIRVLKAAFILQFQTDLPQMQISLHALFLGTPTVPLWMMLFII